jgi:hypothetical protein
MRQQELADIEIYAHCFCYSDTMCWCMLFFPVDNYLDKIIRYRKDRDYD